MKTLYIIYSNHKNDIIKYHNKKQTDVAISIDDNDSESYQYEFSNNSSFSIIENEEKKNLRYSIKFKNFIHLFYSGSKSFNYEHYICLPIKETFDINKKIIKECLKNSNLQIKIMTLKELLQTNLIKFNIIIDKELNVFYELNYTNMIDTGFIKTKNLDKKFIICKYKNLKYKYEHMVDLRIKFINDFKQYISFN